MGLAEDTLVEKMRALAPGHPRRHELLERAQELEDALSGYATADSPRKMLGCWARARLLYTEITGESLV